MNFKILNLTVDRQPFIEFDRIKRLYYRKRDINFNFIYNDDQDYNFVSDKEDIMYRFGLPPDYEYRLNNLVTNDSGVPLMLNKFLSEIRKPEYCDYDYVIRTNSSSFLNVDILTRLLSSKTLSYNNYAGLHFPKNTLLPTSFISGTMLIIPKSIILKLRDIEVPPHIEYQCDDVALGILIETMCQGIPHNIPLYSCSINDIPNINSIVDNNMLLRIRHSDMVRNNINDINIWKSIESYILN